MLNLPPNFERDIQGKDTALVPVVMISISNSDSPAFIYPYGDSSLGYAPSVIILSTSVISGNYRRMFQEYQIAGHGQGLDTLETWTSKPLLLNIPSLKESIDIEKRNYKISSINIDISNFPYEGKRFSELIANQSEISQSLINVECRIWWASPSANVPYTSFDPGDDSAAMQIYNGSIRRYTHDAEKLAL